MNIFRSIALLLFATIISQTTWAQIFGDSYIVNKAVRVSPCLDDGTPVAGSQEVILPHVHLIIFLVLKDSIVISIPEFKKKKDALENNRLVYNTEADSEKLNEKDRKYFLLPKSSLKNIGLLPDYRDNGGFVFGPLITPIKMRLPSKKNGEKTYFQLTSDVNLGVAAGHKFAFYSRNKPWELAILGAISVSSIEMKPETTGGYLTTDNNIAALTETVAIVYIKHSFQIGLMIGYDHPSGEVGTKWIYRNVPWVGIGLGVALFSNNNSKTKPIQFEN